MAHPIALCGALLLVSMAFFLILVSHCGSGNQGRLASCKANLESLASALESYAKEHQGHYPKNLTQLAPHYIAKIPSCVAGRRESYSTGYRSCAKPDSFVILCCGHNHEHEGVGLNQPGYSREGGFSVRPPSTRHQLTRCQSTLTQMAGLIEDFRKKQGRLPTSLAEVWPGSDLTYTVLSSQKFRLSCAGLCHAHEGLQANEPAFDSQMGLVACVTNLTPKNPRWKNRRRDEGSFPVFLGIPAFIFILFTLWPFEPASSRDRGYQHSSNSAAGWKIIARRPKAN